MVNILIPAMGSNTYFKDYYFPKLMLELNGETILEKVLSDFDSINDKRFILIFNDSECHKFHLNDAARVLTGDGSVILALKNATKGPLCTSLMAINEINNDDPLLIVNSDQIIDVDYADVIASFRERKFEAGILTFPSIHPRWDYIRTEEDRVIEVARKHPVSKYAVGGFFWFRNGKDFIEAGKRAILKNCFSTEDYSISSALNEMILMNKRIGFYNIEKEQFHSFYSPEKIREYNEIVPNCIHLKNKTQGENKC